MRKIYLLICCFFSYTPLWSMDFVLEQQDTIPNSALILKKDSLENQLEQLKYNEELLVIEQQIIDTTYAFKILDDSLGRTQIQKDVLEYKRKIKALRDQDGRWDAVVQKLVTTREALKAETNEVRKEELHTQVQAAAKAFRDFEEEVGLKALSDEYMPVRAKFLEIYDASGRNRMTSRLAELRKRKAVIEKQLNLDIASMQKEIDKLNQKIIKKEGSW